MIWKDWVELTLVTASALAVGWIVFPLNKRMNELWFANKEIGELQKDLYELEKKYTNPWAKLF